MDITDTIAVNLGAWMGDASDLNTIKKVAAVAKVGFGTVRRARKGEGNTTIQNLDAIAKAFKRPLEDLIRPAPQSVQEPRTNENYSAQLIPFTSPESSMITEIVTLAGRMNDRGLAQYIERGLVLATEHPKAKANPAS